MITEAVIFLLLTFLTFVLGLLPDDTLSWPEAENIGEFFGNAAGPLDVWFPVSELVAVTTLTLTVVLPAMLVYRLAMWLWTLLPDSISGSGPS